MIARLVHSTDFERVLRTRAHAHSDHFALHRLAQHPSGGVRPRPTPATSELSTEHIDSAAVPVDDCRAQAVEDAPKTLWWGAVVPKRHARRAVTRTLLKRQIRAAVERHLPAMSGGLWVIRLRAPFDRKTFVSSASDALRRCAREELDVLIRRAKRAEPAHV